MDLCFGRSTDKRITPMNIELPFSDHKGIIVNIGRKRDAKRKIKVTKWSVTQDMYNEAVDYPCIIEHNGPVVDVDKEADLLTSWLSHFQSKALSVVSKTINENKKPWYSSHLMELKSNYMNAIDLDMRKQLRNKYVNAIKRAKSSYFC